jgi:hypothetical protein
MGQAKRRGTFEERKAQAIEKYEDSFRMNMIKPQPCPRIPPGYAALMAFFAIAEADAKRQRDFFSPVCIKE